MLSEGYYHLKPSSLDSTRTTKFYFGSPAAPQEGSRFGHDKNEQEHCTIHSWSNSLQSHTAAWLQTGDTALTPPRFQRSPTRREYASWVRTKMATKYSDATVTNILSHMALGWTCQSALWLGKYVAKHGLQNKSLCRASLPNGTRWQNEKFGRSQSPTLTVHFCGKKGN